MKFTKELFILLISLLKLRRSDSSHGSEYSHLQSLADTLNIREGWAVDVAAADGVNYSSTVGFYKHGWNGLAVELHPSRFARLSIAYVRFPKVSLQRVKIVPSNIIEVLKANFVPLDFELFNLDIDSYDLEIARSMLEGGFRPQIISMEINEKIPPPVHFSVHFDENHSWSGDHFFGCSLASASHLLKAFGYGLESLNLNNAIYIRNDLSPQIEFLDDFVAYDVGYRQHKNRSKLFPWNKDIDYLLDMDSVSVVDALDLLFEKYKGKYSLSMPT